MVRRSHLISPVRASATRSPPTPPPTKATIDRSRVQRMAARRKRRSLSPRTRIQALLAKAGFAQECAFDAGEDPPEQRGHAEIDAGHDEIDLEAAKIPGLDVAGRRRQLAPGNGRADA